MDLETQYRLTQGTLVLVGTSAVTAGIGFVTNGKLLDGIVLVLIGAGIVFWRELRKDTTK
jgi:hypothetical protein